MTDPGHQNSQAILVDNQNRENIDLFEADEDINQIFFVFPMNIIVAHLLKLSF